MTKYIYIICLIALSVAGLSCSKQNKGGLLQLDRDCVERLIVMDNGVYSSKSDVCALVYVEEFNAWFNSAKDRLAFVGIDTDKVLFRLSINRLLVSSSIGDVDKARECYAWLSQYLVNKKICASIHDVPALIIAQIKINAPTWATPPICNKIIEVIKSLHAELYSERPVSDES